MCLCVCNRSAIPIQLGYAVMLPAKRGNYHVWQQPWRLSPGPTSAASDRYPPYYTRHYSSNVYGWRRPDYPAGNITPHQYRHHQPYRRHNVRYINRTYLYHTVLYWGWSSGPTSAISHHYAHYYIRHYSSNIYGWRRPGYPSGNITPHQYQHQQPYPGHNAGYINRAYLYYNS